jgi:predicted anti-sigma-YlaC factor YlaD
MTCHDTTLSLGVYLLGALDPVERAEVEDHLRDCPSCQDELSELEGLPALLSRLTIEDVTVEPLAVPEDLFERVAARARAEQAQRDPSRLTRHRRLMAVAAAVVVLAAGGVSWSALHSPAAKPSHVAAAPRRSTHPPTHSATQHGVTMTVTLAAQATGTGLNVTVSGLPHDEHCRLIAIAADGSRDVAGRWDATYSGWAQQTGSTSIPQTQLSQLVLLGTGGKNLVTVPV